MTSTSAPKPVMIYCVTAVTLLYFLKALYPPSWNWTPGAKAFPHLADLACKRFGTMTWNKSKKKKKGLRRWKCFYSWLLFTFVTTLPLNIFRLDWISGGWSGAPCFLCYGSLTWSFFFFGIQSGTFTWAGAVELSPSRCSSSRLVTIQIRRGKNRLGKEKSWHTALWHISHFFKHSTAGVSDLKKKRYVNACWMP